MTCKPRKSCRPFAIRYGGSVWSRHRYSCPIVVSAAGVQKHLWWPRRLTLAFLIISNAMDDEAMRWTMRRCDGRWGDAMDDEAMRWTMRRCDGRWGDAMRRCDGAMLPSSIASPHRPSHRLIVHRIASSSIASPHRPSHRLIASPHRPSHRLIVHRIASSSIALDIIRNASVSLLGHHKHPLENLRKAFTHAMLVRAPVNVRQRRMFSKK